MSPLRGLDFLVDVFLQRYRPYGTEERELSFEVFDVADDGLDRAASRNATSPVIIVNSK